MDWPLYWIFAFNIVLNSALSFFTTVFLIEIIIWGLRVHQPRIKAICRSLPIYKMVVDLLFYHFSTWALFHSINPLQATPGSRTLFIGFGAPFMHIQFTLEDGKTFTLADIAAQSFHPLWIQMIVAIAFTGAIGLFITRLIQLRQGKKWLKEMKKHSISLDRPIIRTKLADRLKKSRMRCVICHLVDSPCSSAKTLYFPPGLCAILSQDEFEAIVAHEASHLR
jgi:hypothetical protein